MLLCVPRTRQLCIPTMKVSDSGMCSHASDAAAEGRRLPQHLPSREPMLSLRGAGTHWPGERAVGGRQSCWRKRSRRKSTTVKMKQI